MGSSTGAQGGPEYVAADFKSVAVLGYETVGILYRSNVTLVAHARAQLDGADVVLKLPAGPEISDDTKLRYRSEYEILRKLNSELVIGVRELRPHRGAYVLVLEHLPDLAPLGQRLARGPLTIRQALTVALGLVDALTDVHTEGVVHKDVNANNVLISQDLQRVVLIDFGISSSFGGFEQSFGAVRALQGTLTHIAPEQTGRMNRSVDYRADYYALGVTLYQVLAGRLPFDAAEPVGLIHAQIAQQATELHALDPNVPEMVSLLVQKLMAKSPDDRYQGPRALKQDLERCLRELGSSAGVTRFELAEGDRPPRLVIPQRVYGRDREVARMLGLFERSAGGTMEWLLVGGPSGIGKSFLVHETHRTITERRGLFAAGKFDQFKRSTPLHGLVEALGALLRQLLLDDEREVRALKDRLTKSLGPNAKLLTDVIPELQALLGELPPVVEVAAAEAQNRFRATFLGLINELARREHPLVLFLDDLQWADASTLTLLEQLALEQPELERALFFVGAFRSNELDAAHPFSLVLQDLARQNFLPSRIELEPLTRADTELLVLDTLGRKPEVQQLAQVVFDKTHGNPFFVSQFLTSLHKDRLLTFDLTTGEWTFDLAAIRELKSTENVAELVLERLRKLPASVQRALALASCIGARFELDTLSDVAASSAETLMALLSIAASEGFVTATSSSRDDEHMQHGRSRSYRFIHDRVQQAAHALIGVERAQVSLQIARSLLRSTAGRAERIFETLAHALVAAPLLTERAERDQFAQLFLVGGLKAREATAYDLAAQYLQQARALLPSDPFGTHFELAFKATQTLAECEFLLGRREHALELFAESLAHARSRAERTNIQTQLSTLATHQQRSDEAIAVSLRSLADYGLHWKRKTSTLHVLWTLLCFRLALRKTDLNLVRDAGTVDDPEQLAYLRAMMALTPALYVAGESKLYAVAIMTGVRAAMRFGNTSDTALTYIAVGMLLGVAFGNYEQGERFSKMGLEVFKRFPNADLEARGNMMHGGLTVHWRAPMLDALPFLRRGYETGVESGSWLYAGYSLFLGAWVRLHAGEPLPDVMEACETAEAFLVRSHNLGSRVGTQAVRGVCLALSDPSWSEPDVVPEPYSDEELLRKTVTKTGLHSVAIARLLVAIILGERERALRACELSKEVHLASFALLNSAMHFILVALVYCEEYPDAPWQKRLSYGRFIGSARKKLRTWARNAPFNFEDKRLLLEGAWARARADHAGALDYFDAAGQAARKYGAAQFEGLAWELAAKSATALGKPHFARMYLWDARRAYQRWGAPRKVALLDAQDAELVQYGGHGVSVQAEGKVGTSMGTGRTMHGGDPVDLLTVVRASQVLSGEVVLDRLIEKLLRMAIQNAGATQGALLFPSNGRFEVRAYGRVDGSDVTVELCRDGSLQQRVSSGVVQYVERTRRAVVLADASTDSLFAGDLHVQASHARSLLCLPVTRHNQLGSILYLENPLVADVFGPERVELLTLLSTQIAISIENASLYGNLEAKVAERTEQLTLAQHDIERLLDNMRQAIVAFDAQGRIVGRSSREASQVFQTTIREGMPIEDVLFAGVPQHDLGRGVFADFLQLGLDFDAASWSDIAALLPSEIVADRGTPYERTLVCEFRPILEEGRVSRIMVLALDDTERRKLGQELRERELVFEREMGLMRKLLSGGGHLFVAFMRATEQRLGRFEALLGAQPRECDRATIEELFQHVHTMKTEARAYELGELAQIFALMEDRLDLLRSRMGHARSASSESFHRELCESIALARGAIAELRQRLVRASPIGEAVLDQLPVRESDLRGMQEVAARVSSSHDPAVRELLVFASRLASRPIGESTARLVESTPAWAASLGKRAQLVIEGTAVPVPPGLARVLPGALAHLVRNALAHGIEPGADRLASHKPELGTITIRAQAGEPGPSIVVEDDGRGLDLERLRERARTLALNVEDGREWDLIFANGLSTHDAVNDMAGRGVGMAAVRAELLAAGYRVEVIKTDAHGTQLRLYPVAEAPVAELREVARDRVG